MAVEKVTDLGSINITNEAIASLAGGVVTESYGVVGMASRNILRDGIAELLNMENYAKGVNVNVTSKGLEIDVYIIVSFGVRISQVVSEVQKNIKYVLEKTLQQDIIAVNVFVQGVSVKD
ncbi:MAG: Asp23/Gls24 family envelope stress response protein [Erysipelotrichaceae bacterium]|nr:Asp23/Gls24 family envelope stress response protein [Erysipelotrichaceae bacterium]